MKQNGRKLPLKDNFPTNLGRFLPNQEGEKILDPILHFHKNPEQAKEANIANARNAISQRGKGLISADEFQARWAYLAGELEISENNLYRLVIESIKQKEKKEE